MILSLLLLASVKLKKFIFYSEVHNKPCLPPRLSFGKLESTNKVCYSWCQLITFPKKASNSTYLHIRPLSHLKELQVTRSFETLDRTFNGG